MIGEFVFLLFPMQFRNAGGEAGAGGFAMPPCMVPSAHFERKIVFE